MQVTTSRVGGILPRQIQRMLPILVAFVLLIMFFSRGDSLGSADVVKRWMSSQTAMRPTMEKFPNKIWQLWKIDGMNLDQREAVRARSWTSKNPGHRYEMLTDGNGMRYVETNFGPNGVINRPDIVYMYRHLTATIIQADLLRYLVMYVEGGIYTDVDVEALKPIEDFIPPPFNEKDIDLVVGVEIDEPSWANHTILGPKSQSFCQWTFMCKPRLPVMLRLIDGIIDWLNEISRQQDVPISEIKLNFDEVITGTGPSAFTAAVLAEMKAQTGQEVVWDQFHAIKEPKQVGNTLVLTVYAFAAGQGHSDSGDHENPAAVARHHYHASLWPDRHPRYSHPAFGMVEECNWHKDCVDAWDGNTTLYKTLPEEQQQALIEVKKKADAEKYDQEQAENEQHAREDEENRNAELRALCAQVPPELSVAASSTVAEGQAEATATSTTSIETATAESVTTTGSTKTQESTTKPPATEAEKPIPKAKEPESAAAPKHHPQTQVTVGTAESEAMPGMTRKRSEAEEAYR